LGHGGAHILQDHPAQDDALVQQGCRAQPRFHRTGIQERIALLISYIESFQAKADGEAQREVFQPHLSAGLLAQDGHHLLPQEILHRRYINEHGYHREQGEVQ
jgi:hypothetical protein